MDFIITTEHKGQRLDKFLKEHLPEFSRSHLQKLIEEGQAVVNGKKVSVHNFLKEGDKIEVILEPLQKLTMATNPQVRFEVLVEDPDFLVINKPAGLVVHQAQGHKAPDTLVNGLVARYPEIGKVGDDPVRPGIMHRLDADVSGVMVIARTQDMFDHLKKQFKMHDIEKEYVAVVEGRVIPPQGVIEFVVARKGARMVARPKGGKGKTATTEYDTIKAVGQQNNKTALLKIQTRTGRTHQIRVHLKAINHPIVGDKLYGGARGQGSVVSRLMLHARRLAFKDLKGERHEFICEPPAEFSF